MDAPHDGWSKRAPLPNGEHKLHYLKETDRLSNNKIYYFVRETDGLTGGNGVEYVPCASKGGNGRANPLLGSLHRWDQIVEHELHGRNGEEQSSKHKGDLVLQQAQIHCVRYPQKHSKQQETQCTTLHTVCTTHTSLLPTQHARTQPIFLLLSPQEAFQICPYKRTLHGRTMSHT